jgi:type I restriction enzyme S subunit
MIDGLKPYPAMKDSGVPWLGEVPEHWDVRPLGRIGALFKGNGGNKGDEVASGIPCVRYGDLYTRHEFFITRSKACVSTDRANAYTRIRYGDVLFAASGETVEDIGRAAVNLIEGEARCGGDVLVLRPEVPALPRFLGYAADSPPSRHQKACMGRGFTVVHIYGSELKRLALALPPLPEQAAIVRFLDHADRRIRRYIRAKQKLLKLLEEYKQAIIHRAVTRGLDSNVRLKPSGVEWLGDVPEHWEVVALKRVLTRLVDCEHKTAPEVEQSDYRVVRTTAVRNGQLRWSGTYCTSAEAFKNWTQRAVPEPYDVIFTREAPAGEACLVPEGAKVCLGQRTVLMRLHREEYDAQFLVHMIYAGPPRLRIQLASQGSTVGHFNMDDIGSMKVLVPPLAEQQSIVAAIARDTASLTEAAERAERELHLLREYRTRLIADVVTGKLDVREAAARLSDESKEPEPLDEPEALGDEPDDSAGDGLDAEPEEAEA